MSVGVVNKQTGERIPTAGMPAIDNALDLTSVNPVQNAVITAALANKQDKTDNALQTTDKTVVGGINELKSGFTNLDNEVNGDATEYTYADVITIEDAVPSNLADCSVKIEPVQDLHGYDKPWVGGAGRQKLPLILADIKASNTSGTWNGNVYTINGDTVEVLVDSDNNVLGFKINKTHNVQISFNIFDNKSYAFDGSYDFVGESVLKNGEIAYTYTFDNASIDVTNPNGVTQAVDDNLNHAHIYIWAAKTYTNQILTPMVCLSSETDKSFVPYTNVCPISGHTEVDVQRDGKNLAGDFEEDKVIDYATGNITNNSNYHTTGWIIVKQGQKITVSGKGYGGERWFYNEDKTPNSQAGINDGTYTAPVNGFFRASVRKENTTLQIEYGSTATDYVPYLGKTYTIALGDTIYGGTVDFDSGVMTVKNAKRVFDGTENWQIATSDPSAWFYVSNSDGVAQTNNIICNEFTAGTGVDKVWINFSQVHLHPNSDIIPSGYTADGLAELKAWLANNNMEIVYPLATPFTVQLTPQQIQLLKGQNTLTASTGDISVTVNGVSGAIGQVQEQVNELAEEVAEIKPLDYSTTEQKTGQKWIDGKDIYVKVFTDLSATIIYNNWVNIVEYPDVDSLIDYKAYSYAKHIISGVGIEVRYDSTSGYFQVQGEVNIANSRTITILVAFYTKST